MYLFKRGGVGDQSVSVKPTQNAETPGTSSGGLYSGSGSQTYTMIDEMFTGDRARLRDQKHGGLPDGETVL